jgi:hypothetical protein
MSLDKVSGTCPESVRMPSDRHPLSIRGVSRASEERTASPRQPSEVSAEQTASPLPAMSPEVREAVIALWAEIFTAEIRELSAITVRSPSGSDHV